MIDIRTHILSRVYGQCIKLLTPDIDSDEFDNMKVDFPTSQYVSYNAGENGIDITDSEESVIDESRIMNEVWVADVDVLSLGQHPQSKDAQDYLDPPVIILDFGSQERMETNNSDKQPPQNMCLEGLMTIIRTVFKGNRGKQPFNQSNAVRTNRVRESLDYLLDPSYFRLSGNAQTGEDGSMIKTSRPGYQNQSKIIDCYIMSSRPYGVVGDKYITDFLFVVEFWQQKERGQYSV